MIYSSNKNIFFLLTKLTDQQRVLSCTKTVATSQSKSRSVYPATQLRPGVCSQQVQCPFAEVFQELVRPIRLPRDETHACRHLPGAHRVEAT